MTPEREAHLLKMAATMTSVAEINAFRRQIIAQSEGMTTDLLLAISSHLDRLKRAEIATAARGAANF